MSTALGRQAEQAVHDWLINQGFSVVARNWRTRYCEIDIVAYRSRKIYFIEVKYRSSVDYGSGFAYVGPKKIQKMVFASQLFCAKYNVRCQTVLSAVEVNKDFNIESYVELSVN